MYKEQELFIFILNIYIYTFFLRYPTLPINFNYTTFIIIVTKYYLIFTQHSFHNKKKISLIRRTNRAGKFIHEQTINNSMIIFSRYIYPWLDLLASSLDKNG